MRDPDPTALSVPPDALRQIYAQARAEFPNECCGYLFGRGVGARYVACTNRQDRLNQLDPSEHPRTGANAYNIGGRELLDLVNSFETDSPVTIIVHSHPRVGAYFSAEDTRAAVSAGYPVEYLVVDAQPDAIACAVLFRRDGDRYVEVERYPGDGSAR